MQLARSDLFGGICAGLALCLIVWLSLDSMAINRCDEILASSGAGEDGSVSPEQARCLKRRKVPVTKEN